MSSSSVPQEEPAQREGFVAVGSVKSPWGRLGEVRVKSLTDNPSRFAPGQELYIRGERYISQTARPHKGDVLLKLEGVDSPEDAEALRGTTIEVPLEWLVRLPEDTFYQFQLLGMEVWTSQGEYLGKVAQIIETGSNDVYVVQGGEREILLPAIGEVVKEVDVAAGRMVVALMEGL